MCGNFGVKNASFERKNSLTTCVRIKRLQVRIEIGVEIRYNLSAGSMSAKSVWQDFVLVFRKCW